MHINIQSSPFSLREKVRMRGYIKRCVINYSHSPQPQAPGDALPPPSMESSHEGEGVNKTDV